MGRIDVFDLHDKQWKCFCGLMHVREGAIIIGVIGVIVGILSLVGILIIAPIAGLMIYGATKERSKYFIPYIILQILFIVTFIGLLIWASVALSRINFNHNNNNYYNNNPYDHEYDHNHGWDSWKNNWNYNRDYPRQRPIQFRTDDGRIVFWDPFAFSDGLDRKGALAIIIVMLVLIVIQVTYPAYRYCEDKEIYLLWVTYRAYKYCKEKKAIFKAEIQIDSEYRPVRVIMDRNESSPDRFFHQNDKSKNSPQFSQRDQRNYQI